MAVAWPYGFEIDFVRNPISRSAAKFFVTTLKLIFTPIFEIEIHEKKFLFYFIEPYKLNDQGETVHWTDGISTEDLIDLKNDLISEWV